MGRAYRLATGHECLVLLIGAVLIYALFWRLRPRLVQAIQLAKAKKKFLLAPSILVALFVSGAIAGWLFAPGTIANEKLDETRDAYATPRSISCISRVQGLFGAALRVRQIACTASLK